MPSEEVLARARGCMLGLMVGDALGAAVEGFPRAEIRALAQKTWGCNTIEGFIPAVHMGTFVPDSDPGRYRPALKVSDTNFVPSGPPLNENTAKYCTRTGMYTDDTNSALAVASSIVECGRVDPLHSALRCAEMFRDNEAYRGCPPTAKRIMQSTLDGVPIEERGLPPHFPFRGGSFANGGAMRISPLAIAYRSADAQVLRSVVEAAILASHRHPEAVDFAVIQAGAVQYALTIEPSMFDGSAMLADLAGRCNSEGMRKVILATADSLDTAGEGEDEHAAVTRVVNSERRPGSGMGFQIASVHMAPCVMWAVCRYHADPRAAVKAAIDLGGDTDTAASMVGAIVGALHGESWCGDWAGELENGPHGRDYALGLAEKLADLDLRE